MKSIFNKKNALLILLFLLLPFFAYQRSLEQEADHLVQAKSEVPGSVKIKQYRKLASGKDLKRLESDAMINEKKLALNVLIESQPSEVEVSNTLQELGFETVQFEYDEDGKMNVYAEGETITEEEIAERLEDEWESSKHSFLKAINGSENENSDLDNKYIQQFESGNF
jgi:hypothetical protein